MGENIGIRRGKAESAFQTLLKECVSGRGQRRGAGLPGSNGNGAVPTLLLVDVFFRQEMKNMRRCSRR